MLPHANFQQEFPLEEKSAAPVISPADVERLMGALRGGQWMTAASLAGALREGWTDRKVRAVARAAGTVIVSYPGSPGYKLWADCSVQEIDHAIEAIESQARDMGARALLYRRAWHARFRGTLP